MDQGSVASNKPACVVFGCPPSRASRAISGQLWTKAF
jgi:hypothetical protein